MGMTIDESINWVDKNILEMRNWQLCITDKHALSMAIEIMRKYQKIEHIVDRPTGNNAEEKAYNYMMIVKDIKEVLEDGNDTTIAGSN